MNSSFVSTNGHQAAGSPEWSTPCGQIARARLTTITLRQRGMHAQLRPLEKGRRAAAVVVMRTCKRDFPGADQDTSERLAAEVAADERAIVDALGALREDASISLEAVGYLMGTNPAQLSRYLKGTTSTSLTNYLRIARALGYRCKFVFEKADSDRTDVLADMKLTPHRVCHHH